MDYETDEYGEYLTQQVEKANLEIRVNDLEKKLALMEAENEELKVLLKEVHISSHGRFPDGSKALWDSIYGDDLK